MFAGKDSPIYSYNYILKTYKDYNLGNFFENPDFLKSIVLDFISELTGRKENEIAHDLFELDKPDKEFDDAEEGEEETVLHFYKK